MNITQWIAFFFIYCFFGWCYETALVSLEEHHFVNRGFLRSPFLPIYGFGALIMVISGKPFFNDPVKMFLCGALAATLMEYVTSWLMELLFKTRYWDYSDCRYNISGRICAEATLLWGFMTLLVNYKIHIHIEKAVLMISNSILLVTDILLIILFIADLVISVKSVVDINHIIKRMTEIKEELATLNQKLRENAGKSENIDHIRDKIKQLHSENTGILKRLNFFKRDIINAHPRAHSIKFNNALTELKLKLRKKSQK